MKRTSQRAFVTTNYNPSDAVKSPTDKKINPQEVVVKEPPSKIESLVKTKNQGIKESQVKNVN